MIILHKGETFLVTGGSRGIGKATVKALMDSGANVAFTYQSNPDVAEAVCAEFEGARDRIVSYQADAQDFVQARSITAQVKERFGGLHGVILNAGITKDKPFFMMSEEEWDGPALTNLKGTFNYARAAIYDFIKQKYGRIVCVSSVSGLMGVPGQTNYSATKAGQIGLVRSLSKEVAKFGITVNAVAPGFISTDMWESMSESQRTQMQKDIPMGRPGKPEEVADAICFLLKSSYITGSVLVIDGGLQA